MKNSSQREKMFALCQEWECSGKRREAFCKEHGLTIATFSYWRTKYLVEQKDHRDGFVTITAGLSSAMEIRYPNGVVLKVPEQMSLSQIKALISL